jgi:hypothetical protein
MNLSGPQFPRMHVPRIKESWCRKAVERAILCFLEAFFPHDGHASSDPIAFQRTCYDLQASHRVIRVRGSWIQGVSPIHHCTQVISIKSNEPLANQNHATAVADSVKFAGSIVSSSWKHIYNICKLNVRTVHERAIGRVRSVVKIATTTWMEMVMRKLATRCHGSSFSSLCTMSGTVHFRMLPFLLKTQFGLKGESNFQATFVCPNVDWCKQLKHAVDGTMVSDSIKNGQLLPFLDFTYNDSVSSGCLSNRTHCHQFLLIALWTRNKVYCGCKDGVLHNIGRRGIRSNLEMSKGE